MVPDNENITPWMATHPGMVIKYELEERGISQTQFAVMMGMQKSHVSELLKGKRPMTKTMAYRIEEVLGLPAVTLVNLQTQYEYDAVVLEQRHTESRPMGTDKLISTIIIRDREDIARRMKTDSISVERISWYTGLTVKQVEAL